MPDAQPLLTPDQAAAIPGTSKRTLETWRRQGKGPHFLRLRGKIVRYSLEALGAFIRDSTLTNTRGGRPESQGSIIFAAHNFAHRSAKPSPRLAPPRHII